jgi:hypothetical protein
MDDKVKIGFIERIKLDAGKSFGELALTNKQPRAARVV